MHAGDRGADLVTAVGARMPHIPYDAPEATQRPAKTRRGKEAAICAKKNLTGTDAQRRQTSI